MTTGQTVATLLDQTTKRAIDAVRVEWHSREQDAVDDRIDELYPNGLPVLT